MNYRKHYDRLIERARTRALDGYIERHHVVPRCLGGNDDPENLVSLTPEEHVIANQLLAKMYKDHPGLALAAMMMATKVSNKAYGWLRRNFATKISEIDRSGWKPKPIQSEEHKQKIAASVRSAWKDPDIRKRQVEAMRGRKLTDDHKAALSKVRKGRKLSEEHKKKIALANQGKSHASNTVTCPHCGKVGGQSNMKRYHFDACKSKGDNHTK
jgi:hypothetical protein